MQHSVDRGRKGLFASTALQSGTAILFDMFAHVFASAVGAFDACFPSEVAKKVNAGVVRLKLFDDYHCVHTLILAHGNLFVKPLK
jgi:hypothetical protein